MALELYSWPYSSGSAERRRDVWRVALGLPKTAAWKKRCTDRPARARAK